MQSVIRLALAVLIAPTLIGATPQQPGKTGGEAIKLSDYAGRWIILNYWATWCAPCIAEMPILSELAKSRPHIVVIGMTTETITPDALTAFLQKHPVAYRIVVADKSTTPHRYSGKWLGMQARPLTYVIRPDGTLAKRFTGGVTKATLDAVLDAPAP